MTISVPHQTYVMKIYPLNEVEGQIPNYLRDKINNPREKYTIAKTEEVSPRLSRSRAEPQSSVSNPHYLIVR